MQTPKVIYHMEKYGGRASGYTKGKNTNTLNCGYWIEHAGSLWAGQANTQNTIKELLDVGKKYGFRDDTIIYSMYRNISPLHRNQWTGIYCFSGNMEKLSNAFNIYVWNPKVVKLIKSYIR